MIISQLLGGMGNQMFQYALGRSLSISNNTILKLDPSILLDWRPGLHAVNRNFDLDIFNLSYVFADKGEIAKFHSHGMSIPEKIVFRLKPKGGIVRERFFHFDPTILALTGDQYLSGTWQSYKYFDSHSDVIRRDFSFKKSFQEHADRMASRIVDTNSVCLNVRRTDYISVSVTAQSMADIAPSYYEKALQLMEERIGSFHVFVFSDDIDWCKGNINSRHPITFVDHDCAGPKFSDYLQLMTMCRNFIIPNSTFAWWGAWLNADQEKQVITPLHWFRDPSINTTDLIPDSWTRI